MPEPSTADKVKCPASAGHRKEQSLLLQPCGLSLVPLRAEPNRDINVCRVPAPASQSLGWRNNGLITCTLLYSEWQEFYWVILFPWMMFPISLMGIRRGRGAQQLLNLSVKMYTPGEVSEHWRALIGNPHSRIAVQTQPFESALELLY